ncbi:MAG: hypothetical protein ACHQUC_10360 [Chlamydiales bacterium]
MAATAPIPPAIGEFFGSIYGTTDHLIEQSNRNNVTYSMEGRNISILTNSYGQCHVTIKKIDGTTEKTIRAAIQQLIKVFAESKAFDSVWVNFPDSAPLNVVGKIIEEPFGLSREGRSDFFKDSQAKMRRFWVWINADKACIIPMFPHLYSSGKWHFLTIHACPPRGHYSSDKWNFLASSESNRSRAQEIRRKF